MMSTATEALSARTKPASGARSIQPTNVAIAMEMTTGTKTALMRSANFCIGARDACASRINVTICESIPAVPTAVAR